MQKLIEVWENKDNKRQEYLWEYELGWLDMQFQIDILEKMLEKTS